MSVYCSDEEYHFVDLETKLHKLVGTKTWKNCSTGGGRDRQRQMVGCNYTIT